MITALAGGHLDAPVAFRAGRCETASCAAIPALVALQAAMLGHIRRRLAELCR